MAPDISEILGADRLSPEGQDRVNRAVADDAYFRGRVATILEYGEKRHENCKTQRETNETDLFKRVGSLEKKWAKLVGYILGGVAAIGAAAYLVDHLLQRV